MRSPLACHLEGATVTHQNQGIHDVFADLQTRRTCYFQKQIRSCFLNLKKKPGRFQKRVK